MISSRRSKVVGAGLIALDMVIGSDPGAPIRCWAGGTCGNVLSILAYLGWDAYPVARMNGDGASERIREDMARWGVHLDLADCRPSTNAPIVVHRIRQDKKGQSVHRFSRSCPHCAKWLPAFKPITVDAVDRIKPSLADASVFFLDRLSRATLMLAAEASGHGAVVVFEPSTKGSEKHMAEALAIAHVIKYADNRFAKVDGVMQDGSAALLEIQTLGARGLRYRHRLGRGASTWMHLKAIDAPRLADACGSGDWCTAGLIAKAAVGGQEGLRRTGARGIRGALRYGQVLAAWNCCFEGARGGMYAVSEQVFAGQIANLLDGRFDGFTGGSAEETGTQVVTCPACPPTSRRS